MNKNKNEVTSSGIGFSGLLTIAFIVLKLIGVIDWSWWWVLSPLWISAGIIILIYSVTILVVFIKKRKGKKK